jgi:hypothetical protein
MNAGRNVYIVVDGAGRRKIGFSGNVENRLRDLQVGHPSKLELERFFVCGSTEGNLVERTAHKLLASKRLQGEWFDVSFAEACAAIELAIESIKTQEIAACNRIGLRLFDDERAALDAAAEEKSLALSAMVRMIVAEWLRKHGWLRRSRKS